MYTGLLVILLCVFQAQAQFFNSFFGGHQQQQQQQQPKKSYEDEFLNTQCKDYLCPETNECVKTPVDCPCPFPKSQLKCILPDKKNFVCISKPASDDDAVNRVYDDPKKGPVASIEGYRDCGWVKKAYEGLV